MLRGCLLRHMFLRGSGQLPHQGADPADVGRTGHVRPGWEGKRGPFLGADESREEGLGSSWALSVI